MCPTYLPFVSPDFVAEAPDVPPAVVEPVELIEPVDPDEPDEDAVLEGDFLVLFFLWVVCLAVDLCVLSFDMLVVDVDGVAVTDGVAVGAGVAGVAAGAGVAGAAAGAVPWANAVAANATAKRAVNSLVMEVLESCAGWSH